MGLFTKKEFAENCGIKTKELSVYVQRKKVFLTSEGLVDDQNIINALFLQKCLAKPPKVAKDESVPDVEKPQKPEKAQKAQISEKKKQTDSKIDERFDLDTEKKKMEIEKLRRESMTAEMQHEKLMGRLVPTDPVKNLIIQTIKTYTVSFKQAADKIILEFGKRYKMNRNDAAEMRGELVSAINKASEEGIAESKKSVMHLVREYSQAKKA